MNTNPNLPENNEGAEAGNASHENQNPSNQNSPSIQEDRITDEQEAILANHDDLQQEDEGHIEEIHTGKAFAEMSNAELISAFETALQAEEPDSVRNQVRQITEIFESRMQVERDTLLNDFVNSGKAKEEFVHEKSEEEKHFDKLSKKYNKLRTELRRKKEQDQKENLELKKKIIEELRVLSVDSSNLKISLEKLHELQTRWRAIGMVARPYSEDLWKNYRFHIDRFYDLLKINKDLRDLDQKKNFEIKKELCEKAEMLLTEPSINKALSLLRILQEKWRSTGPVSKENSEILWQRFRSSANQIFDRRKEHLGKLEEQQGENLKAKELLCEQMEKLTEHLPKSHKKWQEMFAKVDEIMAAWKKTGFASKKENEIIWDRFRKSRKVFYESRDAFYENQRKEYAHNLKLKTDLCQQAEALVDSTDWKQAAEQYKKLQEQWKQVGTVSPKHSDKLWNRFRQACNNFFENKKNHFAGKEQDMKLNLEKKNELISRISTYQIVEDYAQNISAIQKFQNEWLEIGMVPYQDKDVVNRSYHKTLDKIMNSVRTTNPQSKNQLARMNYEHKGRTGEGMNELKMERSRLQERISRLQKEVNQLENNIEFFGKSKNAMKMKEEFSAKIQTARDEIQKLKDELNMMSSATA